MFKGAVAAEKVRGGFNDLSEPLVTPGERTKEMPHKPMMKASGCCG